MDKAERTTKMLKNRSRTLIDKAKGNTFKDPILIREMFLQVAEVNKLLVSKVEELENEIIQLKGGTPTENN